MKNISVYIDGASRGNHNPETGGWAAAIVNSKGKVIKEMSGASGGATSNQMKLIAAIESLKYCKKHFPKNRIIIRTTSKHLVKGIAAWVVVWKHTDWVGVDGQPVENADLWQKLDKLNQSVQAAWFWVQAHQSDWADQVDIVAKHQLRELDKSMHKDPFPASKVCDEDCCLPEPTDVKDQFSEMPFETLLRHCDLDTSEFFQMARLPEELKAVALRWHLRGLDANAALQKGVSEYRVA